MGNSKRQLTNVEKAAKKERQKTHQWIFINGKRVRVKRTATIEGLPVDEFLARNADPIWLHHSEMWEDIEPEMGKPSMGNPNPPRRF